MAACVAAGEIIRGKQALSPPEMSGDLGRFMAWVDERRVLRVMTNADTPADAAEVRDVQHKHTATGAAEPGRIGTYL